MNQIKGSGDEGPPAESWNGVCSRGLVEAKPPEANDKLSK